MHQIIELNPVRVAEKKGISLHQSSHSGATNRTGLLIAAIVFLTARFVWEIADPITPDQFKGFIYLRDFILLLPASLTMLLFLSSNNQLRLRRQFDSALHAFCSRPKLWTAVFGILTFAGCLVINKFVLQSCAHIGDEANYLFTAKIFASGRLYASLPPVDSAFFETGGLVFDKNRVFGIFFPGQSVLFALGQLVHMPSVVNPLLAGVLTIIIVWAGRQLYDIQTGIIAGILSMVSPFLLFQGASYFSHLLPAVCITLVITWALKHRTVSTVFFSGVLCGVVLLFRPLSAAITVIFTGIFIGIKIIENRKQVARTLLVYGGFFAAGFLPFCLVFLMYNNALTGSFLITPHQYALPRQKIIFGMHSLLNTFVNCTGLACDLTGVPVISLLLLPVFFFSGSPHSKALFVFIASYIIGYSAYPYHGLSYGPRFYFELLPFLLVICSRMSVDENRSPDADRHNRLPFMPRISPFVLAGTTIVISLFGALPARMAVFGKRGAILNIEKKIAGVVKTPAVVFIRNSNRDKDRLSPFFAGLQLNTPDFNGEVVYANYLPDKIGEFEKVYANRHMYVVDIETAPLQIDTLPRLPEE